MPKNLKKNPPKKQQKKQQSKQKQQSQNKKPVRALKTQTSNEEVKRKKVRKRGSSKKTRKEKAIERKKKMIRQKLDRRQALKLARLKAASKFQIRCRQPVEDEIFDVDEYVKYITEHFKVDGQTGQIGTDSGRTVTIQKSQSTVHIASKKPFPKYYLKYLTKRYLKKHGLRDYVRVIADKKSSYELRYFNIQEDKKSSKN